MRTPSLLLLLATACATTPEAPPPPAEVPPTTPTSRVWKQPRAVVVRHATVLTATGPAIEDGAVAFVDGNRPWTASTRRRPSSRWRGWAG